MKRFNEFKDMQLKDHIKIKGHIYQTYKIDKYNKMFVGEDGILGDDEINIPWELIEKFSKQFKK